MRGKFTGGRKVGSKNKLTQVNRAFISDLLNEQGDSIQQALKELYNQNKQAYLGVIVKLLDHVLPRLKEQEIEEDERVINTHVFKLKGNDKITFNGN